MPAENVRRPPALTTLLVLSGAWMSWGCATTPSPAEPPRTAQIAGLDPLPDSAAAARDRMPAEGPSGAVAPAPEPAATAGIPRAANATADGTGCAARVGSGAVRRSALSRTLDAGLGSWLRGVDVEPKLERGRFQGWLIRGIYPGDPCWAGIDLRAGDVVSRINRRPIERPEQAQVVWTALRAAEEIVVELQRDHRARTVRFSVVDDAE